LTDALVWWLTDGLTWWLTGWLHMRPDMSPHSFRCATRAIDSICVGTGGWTFSELPSEWEGNRTVMVNLLPSLSHFIVVAWRPESSKSWSRFLSLLLQHPPIHSILATQLTGFSLQKKAAEWCDLFNRLDFPSKVLAHPSLHLIYLFRSKTELDAIAHEDHCACNCRAVAVVCPRLPFN
jgi:hypothetical protein